MLTSVREAVAAQRKSTKTSEAQETCTPSREDSPKEILSARELLIKTSQREIPISTIAALTPLVLRVMDSPLIRKLVLELHLQVIQLR